MHTEIELVRCRPKKKKENLAGRGTIHHLIIFYIAPPAHTAVPHRLKLEGKLALKDRQKKEKTHSPYTPWFSLLVQAH